jgi:hypothetical protein
MPAFPSSAFRPALAALGFLLLAAPHLVASAAPAHDKPRQRKPQPGDISLLPENPFVEQTPLQVVERLDAVVQSKFLRFNLDRFGPDRTVRLSGHSGVRLWADGEREENLLTEVLRAHRHYAIFYRPTRNLSRRSRAIRQTYLRPVDESRAPRDRTPPPADPGFEEAVTKNLAGAEAGKAVNVETGDWLLALRPILVRRGCSRCHGGVEIGETLGVMVYAISREPWREVPPTKTPPATRTK